MTLSYVLSICVSSREVDFVAGVVCCFSGYCDTFLQLKTLEFLCECNCCGFKLEGRINEQVLYLIISNNKYFHFSLNHPLSFQGTLR